MYQPTTVIGVLLVGVASSSVFGPNIIRAAERQTMDGLDTRVLLLLYDGAMQYRRVLRCRLSVGEVVTLWSVHDVVLRSRVQWLHNRALHRVGGSFSLSGRPAFVL